MTPNYLAGRTRAQQQWIADEIDAATRHARMAQHFEAINAETVRADWYLRLIHVARILVVLALVGAAAVTIVRGAEKLAHDVQVELPR